MSDTQSQTGNPRTGVEFPSPDKLRVYGDISFLAMRSAHHRRMNLANFRDAIETPIELGQFKIFRFDDIPRGFLTWAMLGAEAEAKLVSGQGLAPADWRSGDHMWLIDLVAPYRGLIAGMSRWIMQPGNFSEQEFYFRRVKDGHKTRKILHVDFQRSQGKSRILHDADFLPQSRT